MIVTLALAHLIAGCAPRVGPVTMAALVTYESGARAFAIHDNTANRSYVPETQPSAAAIARNLLGEGHNIDVGYAQINSANFAAYGISPSSAFEPCVNIAIGSRILRRSYAAARRAYGPGGVALAHALSAYNTGSAWAGLDYARRVYQTAASLRYEGHLCQLHPVFQGDRP